MPWYVIVERSTLPVPTTEDMKPLPPYGVGPFDTEAEARKEGQSDSALAFDLLTDRAKKEQYNADDCYWTEEPPADMILIEPPELIYLGGHNDQRQ